MISIIMPVKNAAPFLEDCIDSIIDQTYSNWELIAVDDHSSDETRAILEKYAILDPRIIAETNKGKGITPALITGFDKSSGDYIHRMDADDLMPPEKLFTMIKDLKSREGHVVTGKVSYISVEPLGDGYIRYENWLNSLVDSNSHFNEIYKECVIPSPCWMMKKSDFIRIGGFHSQQYPEDYDLCFRIYKNGMKVHAIDQVLHFWRDHSNRASRNDPNYADNSFLQLKTQYFLELDYKLKIPLILWGAGSKGKALAKYLQKKEIEFTWITDNMKKLDRDIYSVRLTSSSALENFTEAQVIIAVSSPDDQFQIKRELEKYPNHQSYWFY